MDVQRHVEFDGLFVERIPVAITHRRRLAAIVLVGIGIEQEALEAIVLHAVLHLFEAHAHGLAALLRQTTDADEAIGKELHTVRNDLVAFVDVPLHQIARLFGMHGLEWTRRDQLHVDAVVRHVLDVAAGCHFLLVIGGNQLLFGVLHPAATVRAAM
jgi:hypothetical protein